MFDGSKEAGIVISTYNKIALSKDTSNNDLSERIHAVDWGLVILDEV